MILSGAQLAQAKTITVSADGSGDFKTLTEAIAAVPDNSTERTVIHLKPGTYPGQILLPESKANVTFEGEDAAKTILTYALNVNDPAPEGTSPQYKGDGVVILGNDFHAEKITFQNTSGNHGQAMALRVDGDRAIFQNCRLLGWQDTLLVSQKRQYFHDCYIEGRVDFIYGAATAVFDHCEIHSKNGGHVTAASTPQDRPYGFVFLHCRLTGDPAPWVNPAAPAASAPVAPVDPAKPPKADLGRPWRPYGSVTYIDCEMGDHIKPEGWNNWGKTENEKTARYAEYHSTGPGGDSSRRVPWAKQLTKEEAAQYTIAKIFGDWNPTL